MDYNYKIVLSYDGGRYEGWQRQNGRLTIQETVEECISAICGEKVKVIASGRTDGGVHAMAQTANFHTTRQQKPEQLKTQGNRCLPEDIKILQAEQVDNYFHSRYDALEKTYCYTVDIRERPRVFTRRYAYAFPEKINVSQMRRAADMLIGVHDFRSFSSEKRKEKDTVRNLKNIVIREEKGYIRFYFTGEGFLYHMVRILTGTLLEIGTGKRKPEEIPEIFRAKNRFQAGFMAPAHGLMLLEVKYRQDFVDCEDEKL